MARNVYIDIPFGLLSAPFGHLSAPLGRLGPFVSALGRLQGQFGFQAVFCDFPPPALVFNIPTLCASRACV